MSDEITKLTVPLHTLKKSDKELQLIEALAFVASFHENMEDIDREKMHRATKWLHDRYKIQGPEDEDATKQ